MSHSDLPACGRSFIVQGRVVTAESRFASGWVCERRVDSNGVGSDLNLVERVAVGEWWTQVGLRKHASIATFSRFVLQLLEVGAPADLVEDSARALAEETEHARLAFTLASDYLGQAVGPSGLPTHGAPNTIALADVVRQVFEEGCVGATIATLEATHALAHSTEPRVCAALERSARDERRHAELGWRFVRWALAVDPELVSVVQAQFATCCTQLGRAHAASAPAEGAPPLRAATLLAHGVVAAAARAALREIALFEVVRPCVDALVLRRAA